MADRIELGGRYYRMYPSLATPAGEAYLNVSWPIDECALVLVDVYGRPDDVGGGPTNLTTDQARVIADELPDLIAACRAAGVRVVYLQNRLSEWLHEGSVWRNLSLRTCGVDVLETWASHADAFRYTEPVEPRSDDLVVDKQMYSGFFRTELEETLRGHGIRNLMIAGFDSRLCLAQTAIDAMYRDFEVLVVRDCIATFEFAETAAAGSANFLAVRAIEANVGITTTAAELISALEKGNDA